MTLKEHLSELTYFVVDVWEVFKPILKHYADAKVIRPAPEDWAPNTPMGIVLLHQNTYYTVEMEQTNTSHTVRVTHFCKIKERSKKNQNQ